MQREKCIQQGPPCDQRDVCEAPRKRGIAELHVQPTRDGDAAKRHPRKIPAMSLTIESVFPIGQDNTVPGWAFKDGKIHQPHNVEALLLRICRALERIRRQ